MDIGIKKEASAFIKHISMPGNLDLTAQLRSDKEMQRRKKIETAERGEVHAFSVRLTAASTFFF